MDAGTGSGESLGKRGTRRQRHGEARVSTGGSQMLLPV